MTWKVRHPTRQFRRHLRAGVGVPAAGQEITGGAFFKTAGAIFSLFGKLVFNIAPNGQEAQLLHTLGSGAGICAVGNHIARVDDAIGWNPHVGGAKKQRLHSFQITICPAADQKRLVNRAENSCRCHVLGKICCLAG